MQINHKLISGIMLSSAIVFSVPSFAGTTEIDATAEVHFADLKDGDSVASPLTVKFASSGVTIEPAGPAKPNAGHYHLLIDTTMSADEMQYAIASDDNHLHFGKAQTETSVTLAPGKHTLQIVLGDGAHELHKTPVMSKVITVNVK
jgi:Domain of unknown function (DUF4399)